MDQKIAAANQILLGLEDRVIRQIESALDRSWRKLQSDLRGKFSDRPDLLGRDRAILLSREIAKSLQVLDPKNPKVREIEDALKSLVLSADNVGANLSRQLLEPYMSASSTINISLDAAIIVAIDSYQRLIGRGEAFASDATLIIQEALIQGWGTKKTTAALKSRLEITRTAAETIARTESMRAAVGATKTNFAASGVELACWIATQDRRTCPRCAERAGKIYQLSSIVMPIHPRDRCFITPYRQEWADAGLIDSNWLDNHHREAVELAQGEDFSPSPWEVDGKAKQYKIA